MAKDFVHDARRSWWNGDVTTRCGMRFPGGTGDWEHVFLGSVTCRECKNARKRSR